MTRQMITLTAHALNGECIEPVQFSIPACATYRSLLKAYAYFYDDVWHCSHRDMTLWLQLPGVVRA